MHTRIIAASAAAFLLLAATSVANADAVVASCTGTPNATSILWSASATGGTSPYTFHWSNGVTGPTQSVVETPGSYSIGVQATDSSSTPSTSATSTCSATVAWPAPTISSFTATPSTITVGGIRSSHGRSPMPVQRDRQRHRYDFEHFGNGFSERNDTYTLRQPIQAVLSVRTLP
jgi:hypothetical protein